MASFEKEEDESLTPVLPSLCTGCGGLLEVPFIRCAACYPTVNICKLCFSMGAKQGAEFSSHENDHPYSVVKYEFSLHDDKWTAAEELKLLDAIMENGFGNWPAIGNRVKTKTAGECESHYLKYYIECPQYPLPKFPDNIVIDRGAPIIYKLSDNPPRPVEGSGIWNDMGGYSASRGDFNMEFDNFVEMDICQMQDSDDDDDDDDEEEDSDDNDDAGGEDTGGGEKEVSKENETGRRITEEEKEKDRELFQEMKCSVLDIYRTALKERQWRKNIVRDYGLINIRRWYALMKAVKDRDSVQVPIIGKHVPIYDTRRMKYRYEKSISLEFFRPFMKLYSAMTFDKYLESLLLEKQLKSDISRLQDYRRHGLTRLGSIKVFHLLRQRRDTTKAKRHLLQDVLSHINDETSAQSWLARQAVLDNPSMANSTTFILPRRQTPRLDIVGLPGYDKLNYAESEMCSEVRLVPQAYMDFSKILINECNKHGSLKLAQARTLIKIDVNKTRKLYDFLILHGHINKDPL